ncbi:hatching enzyme 1.2-like isoform X1 [Daphnia pulex]|uniref:hatching enzyme 1.2-like isoform X1 n=1 Tax=Daphnia pulex TaxID=6669 RepID=UPI001EE0CB2A|nr:hatching enzyme 1.2-like isoform X1 [Daphnia pulex]
MRSPLSMIVAFSSLWFVSVTATPVPQNLDNDFQIQSSTNFITGMPLTEEMKGNFNEIGKELITQSFPWDKQDPTLYEGDIKHFGDKNAILSNSYRWPNAKIPYEISNAYTPDQRTVIAFAMNEYHKYTCIQLVPRTSETNYIRILKSGTGCNSWIGMINRGAQDLSLDDGCVSKDYPGIVLHELMHAAGFFHEHTRPDRDSFVRIDFNNIILKHQFNFNKTTASEVTTLGLPYDYDSVMHYGKNAFAIDTTRPTIIPIPNENRNLGSDVKFTWLDLLKLNTLYCSQIG